MGFVPVLTIEMLPESTPAVVGENIAVKFAVWLAASVSGVVIPDTLNPVPLAVTEVTVTLALPVFESVIV